MMPLAVHHLGLQGEALRRAPLQELAGEQDDLAQEPVVLGGLALLLPLLWQSLQQSLQTGRQQ